MNVLLFASAPTHEYQFLEPLMVREKDAGRADVSVYIQPAPGQDLPRSNVIQDVDAEHLLEQFPHLYQDTSLDQPGSGRSNEKVYNLKNYDLIVAFDPDWTRVSSETLIHIQKWVEDGGGLILVGGQINTLQLARPGGTRDILKPIREVLPVVLADSRIQDLQR